jgi:DNA-binding MarR family transcriptional regulator
MAVPDDVYARVGFQLKRAQAALRAAMEAELRRHGLGVAQYACLELLDHRPGASNAELARAAFVTRQAMNLVLAGLQEAGWVARPGRAEHGRALPARLTPAGGEVLAAARASVVTVEERLEAALDPGRAEVLAAELAAVAEALGDAGVPGGVRPSAPAGAPPPRAGRPAARGSR